MKIFYMTNNYADKADEWFGSPVHSETLSAYGRRSFRTGDLQALTSRRSPAYSGRKFAHRSKFLPRSTKPDASLGRIDRMNASSALTARRTQLLPRVFAECFVDAEFEE